MKKLTILLLFSFMLIYACSDDAVDPTEFDASMLNDGYLKLWKLTGVEVSGMPFMEKGYIDEYIIFDKLGGGIFIYGEDDLSAADTLTIDKFTYEVINNGSKIKLNDLNYGNKPQEFTEFDIIKADNKNLEIKYKSNYFNQHGNVNETILKFTSIIEEDPTPDLENNLLTKGNLKLWRYVEAKVNGQKTYVDCRADDFYMFATDGTGIKIFGDLHCVSGDTTNNDVFNWTFDIDFENIIRTNLHSQWNHEGRAITTSDTMKIISLTEDEFIYEVHNQQNGEDRVVQITYVPYIR